ncbi:MAG TPA: hypothetical protein VJ799_05450 [Nitrososphaeraceae archaeon]|jgi:hypothetical protein|nr:hypothetical protein [Nitrososphaeraceae archaeon]
MNEIKIIFLGLIAIVFSVILLWFFEAPEIIEDKEIEVAIALGIGLLILVLDKRSERSLHEKIHRQHDIIDKMNKMIHEQHEIIMDISNKRNKVE